MTLPYYKRFPRDFFEGTIGMSLEEKGAYGLVLDLIYKTDGRLADDPRYLAGMLGCSVRKWNSIKDRLVSLGKLHIENDIISNSRADYLLIERRTYQDKQRENRTKPNKNSQLEKPPSNHTEPEPDNAVLLARVREAANIFDDGFPDGLTDVSMFRQMIEPEQGEPCDLESDILPAIRVCCERLREKQTTFKSWGYFHAAIIDNRDRRLSGLPAVQLKASGANTDRSGGRSARSGFGRDNNPARKLRERMATMAAGTNNRDAVQEADGELIIDTEALPAARYG